MSEPFSRLAVVVFLFLDVYVGAVSDVIEETV